MLVTNGSSRFMCVVFQGEFILLEFLGAVFPFEWRPNTLFKKSDSFGVSRVILVFP